MSKLDFICTVLTVVYMVLGGWNLIHEHDFIKANTFLLLAVLNYMFCFVNKGK